jgi:hypothetical protein
MALTFCVKGIIIEIYERASVPLIFVWHNAQAKTRLESGSRIAANSSSATELDETATREQRLAHSLKRVQNHLVDSRHRAQYTVSLGGSVPAVHLQPV